MSGHKNVSKILWNHLSINNCLRSVDPVDSIKGMQGLSIQHSLRILESYPFHLTPQNLIIVGELLLISHT